MVGKLNGPRNMSACVVGFTVDEERGETEGMEQHSPEKTKPGSRWLGGRAEMPKQLTQGGVLNIESIDVHLDQLVGPLNSSGDETLLLAAHPSYRAIRAALRIRRRVSEALGTGCAALCASPARSAALESLSSTGRCSGCLRGWLRSSLGGSFGCGLGWRGFGRRPSRRSFRGWLWGSLGGSLGCGLGWRCLGYSTGCGCISTSVCGGRSNGPSDAQIGAIPKLLGVGQSALGQVGLPPLATAGNVGGLGGTPLVARGVARVGSNPPPLQHAPLALEG